MKKGNKNQKKRSKTSKRLPERDVRISLGRQIALPDRLVGKYKWHSLPTTLTANAGGGTYGDLVVNINSMLDIINGTAAVIPYWGQGIQENYKRYRVTHDSIHVTFGLNTGTNMCTEVMLLPALDTTAITTDAIWTNYASSPMAKTLMLSSVAASPNVVKLRHSIALNKLFDPQQYNVQDEYSAAAGAVGLANPATMAYWRIATKGTVSGPSTVSVVFTVVRTVQLYEIERDSNVQALQRARLLQENIDLRNLVADLTDVRAKQLARETSK